MPDAVVIRVPKEDWSVQAEPIGKATATTKPEKGVALSRWRWAIALPWRVLRGMVASCWRRLTGTRAKE